MSEKMKKDTKNTEGNEARTEARSDVKIRRRPKNSGEESASEAPEQAKNAEVASADAPKEEKVAAKASNKKVKKDETLSEENTDNTAKAKANPKAKTAKAEADKDSAKDLSKDNEKAAEKSEKDGKKAAPKNELSKKDNKKIQASKARVVTPATVVAPTAVEAPVAAEPVKAQSVENVKEVAKAQEPKVEQAIASVKEEKPVAKESKDAEVKASEKAEKVAEVTETVNAVAKSQDADSAENKAKQAEKAPAASAKPDHDATKSILPPVGSKATKVTREDEPVVSHVRVISRPEVNAARVVERPQATDTRRDNREGRDNRDGRPPRDNRGGYGGQNRGGQGGGGYAGQNRGPGGGQGGQGAPGGGRGGFGGQNRGPGGGQGGFGGQNRGPGGGQGGQGGQGGNFRGPQDKDGQNRPRGPRPAGTGAPRPAPAFALPPVDNDQSRKKRNKGRRTVDFSSPESQDSFRRRSNMPMGMGDDDENFRQRRRKPKKQQIQQPSSTQPMKAAKRKIRVEEAIRVTDLAHQMGIKSSEIIKVLFGLGVMATINNALDIDTATVVAAEFGYEVEKVGFSEDNYLVSTEVETSPENQKPRPPVVTIMGHVDHGKTSLLDAIRKTNVTTGEAGGITQHIGAYHVKTKRGDIAFLDTPGHEAFTAMRARGAQVTDLVVLVVAADDGVMEQTREAINHSKAAGVPILVAVNKIDKEAANPDRVLRELAELGLQAEDWGGDTVVGYVSAKTGEGLDDLLELIALQAEILELTANPDKAARGRVVEAKLDKGRGPVATVLIQEGTLHQGDAFVCGVFAGRVRAFFNDQGRKIKEAGPSVPVEIQGFDGVPEAGEEFICLTDEKAARRIAESRAIKQRERELAKQSRVTLETFLASTPNDAEAKVLNLVLKADVQGSLEAITEALHKLSTEKVRISVIHSGAGAITETDIMLAAASHAIIIGFNVRPTAKVKDVAEKEMVDIRFYDIIYKLVEEIKAAMTGMLAPISREVYLGQAEVRQTFSVPKIGIIAGCMVNDGKLLRNGGVRLLREGIVVYTGKASSLRRIKDDVKEVTKGFECGVGLENYNDIKVGDVIECFEMVEEAATL